VLGCLAALSRFISRLGEKGLPLYRLLKKHERFSWTTEAQEALDKLKASLTHAPILTPPQDNEPLYCRMDLPGPTTSVGTRTDYSVGPWDYPACATQHLKAWSTRTVEKYSVRKLYMSCTVWKTPRRTRLVLSPYSDL
jgi:hypothetical protein